MGCMDWMRLGFKILLGRHRFDFPHTIVKLAIRTFFEIYEDLAVVDWCLSDA